MPGTLLGKIDLPPAWLIAAMAIAWTIARVLPATVIDVAALELAGYAIMSVGVALMFWCALLFRRRRTSIIPRNTPDAMITGGPYRFSRNPIYLADAVILLGWIMATGSPVGLITLPAFVFIINRRFIEGEEAVLRQKFGDQYSAWSSKVRRWI